MNVFNGPLYRYGGHIELIRFNEYYGIPRGHEHDPVSRLVLVFVMVFHCLFLGKKAIIITSKHGATIFFPITILLYENFKKKCPERRA